MELFIEPIRINKVNGRFLPGHKPFNKGLTWSDYMDMRKAKRVKKNLELGRVGNPNLAGSNRIPVVGIKNGKLYPFTSSNEAARVLKSKGIKVNSRNIRQVCSGKPSKVGKYCYQRKKAGGFMWFFADDPEKYYKYLQV